MLKMENIILEKNLDDVQHWFETKDGEKWFLPYYYGIHVDVRNKTFTYEECDFPDLNELCNNGFLKLKHPYKQSEKYYKGYPKKINVKAIQKHFAKDGFKVSEEAIEHNFYAWKCDMKSGYRDEENGYFLFTPCGCNPLSFRVSSLHKACEDWQQTYAA